MCIILCSTWQIVHYNSIFCPFWEENITFLVMLIHLTDIHKCLFWNRYIESDRRFQHVLEACGVNKSLIKLGVKEGDTVIVGEVCPCNFKHCPSHCFRFYVYLDLRYMGNTMLAWKFCYDSLQDTLQRPFILSKAETQLCPLLEGAHLALYFIQMVSCKGFCNDDL